MQTKGTGRWKSTGNIVINLLHVPLQTIALHKNEVLENKTGMVQRVIDVILSTGKRKLELVCLDDIVVFWKAL